MVEEFERYHQKSLWEKKIRSGEDVKIIEFNTPLFRGDNYLECVNPDKMLDGFLDTYQKHYSRIYILESEILSNQVAYSAKYSQKVFSILNDEGFHKQYYSRKVYIIDSINEFLSAKPQIKKSCYSHGHMSVFFLVDTYESFLKDFNKTKHGYKISGELDTNSSGFPLEGEQRDVFLAFLKEFRIGYEYSAFTFAHDADFLYVITQ